MINRVVLVGRLVKDPELRYTQNGIAVCNFTLAVNRPFSNQDGKKEADFINAIAWRKQAENVANYLKKGSQAGVDGRIQTRSFDNNEGRRVFMTEVVADSVQFLEPKSSGNSSVSNQGQTQQRPPVGAAVGNGNQNGGNQAQGQGFNDDPFAGNLPPIDDNDLPF